MKKEIEVTELFQFHSFSNWVNTASRRFKPYRFDTTICADSLGNILNDGADFGHARDNDLFPVTVYRVDKMEPLKVDG